MVGISIVGNVFSQNEVERIVQGDADCALAVVVINGNRIEPLEESEMIENECGQNRDGFLIPALFCCECRRRRTGARNTRKEACAQAGKTEPEGAFYLREKRFDMLRFRAEGLYRETVCRQVPIRLVSSDIARLA